jgi:hypothetical protein
MSNVSIEIFRGSDADFTELMKPGESPLWTGRPQYGLGLFQLIGAERTLSATMLVGAFAMWAVYPIIVSQGKFDVTNVAIVFGLVTLSFMFIAFVTAASRQHVLSTLFYVITNQRSIVCRQGRNWHLGDRLYVISNPHSSSYPYEITQTRPYPSIRVGTLLDPNELQPFGFGLTHPGQPANWYVRPTVPVAFEQVRDVETLVDLIHAHAS